jgi:hypothetical protein
VAVIRQKVGYFIILVKKFAAVPKESFERRDGLEAGDEGIALFENTMYDTRIPENMKNAQ